MTVQQINSRPRWFLVCAGFLALCVAMAWQVSSVRAADPPAGLYPSPNERIGFGVISDINHFDLAPLHAGWYVNWGTATNLTNPAGLDFAQIIRVGDEIRPGLNTIKQIARDNPGSLWLVGNEPDCIWQDNVWPETYAEQYHDIYSALKKADPTCQIAIGGIVQATPLRLEWLDRVWNWYHHKYGVTMPVDVWNVHNFILQEKQGGWGCEIPPGVDATVGRLYGINDHDDMQYFGQQIVAFRQWMTDRGQRDKPLIVSEYGILFHDGLGYDYARVSAFMLATFDYFLSATDTNIGYPADGNQLVQRWAWYSLDDISFEQEQYTTWSALYDPFPPYNIRQMGVDFGEYAAARVTPYVDLVPVRLAVQTPDELTYGAPATVVLELTVQNRGNMTSEGPIPVEFWDGDATHVGVLVGTDEAPALPRRYAGEEIAQLTWTTVITSPRTIRARVNPGGTITEWDLNNNELVFQLEQWADIAVSAVHVAPETPLLNLGEAITVTVSAEVANLGSLRLVNFSTCFYGVENDSPEALLGCVDTGSLDPSDSVSISLQWGALRKTGLYRIRVIADPVDLVAESDESNNVLELPFLVAGMRTYLPVLSHTGVLH